MKILTALLGLAVLAADPGFTALDAAPRQPTSTSLLSRATDYYRVLGSGKFSKAWSFLSASVQRDNGNDEAKYVQGLKSMFSGLTLVGVPETVELKTTGTNETLVGTVTASVTIAPKDAPSEKSTHVTFWIWEKGEWFFVGDRFGASRTIGFGTGGGSIVGRQGNAVVGQPQPR
jgi:hypothetical protein